MSIGPPTTSATHDATGNASEATRQAADAAALATFKAGGTSAAYQTTLNANAAADFRRRIASAVGNGIDPAVFRQGLWELTGSFT
ncbi:hypothetical protein [Bradyrhizobium sp. dw_411]|uniref:hypothetical protein n=1 Tax=Bradyrhizobium sp. dw_411 TaxID=2720082 RepID=UPI001BCE1D5C|nr:hypothetical protein [Bradyrhizobium sp. dw_411]